MISRAVRACHHHSGWPGPRGWGGERGHRWDKEERDSRPPWRWIPGGCVEPTRLLLTAWFPPVGTPGHPSWHEAPACLPHGALVLEVLLLTFGLE